MKQELIMKKKELPEEWKLWELLKLSDVCISIDSGTWGNDPQEDNSFPILRSNNIQDSKIDFNDLAFRSVSKKDLINKTLEIGDIIVTKSSGSSHLIGKNAIFETGNKKTYLFANFLERLKPNKAIILPKFLYYYLNSPSGKDVIDKMHSTTSGLRNLNLNMYKEQILLVPPLPIQQKIVSKLDKQMEQIEMMKKEAEKEKEASEAYYESFTNYLILNLKNGILSKISDVCKEYKKQLPPASEDAKKRIYIGMEDISSNTGIIKINQSNQGEKILSNTFQFDSRHILYGKLRPYLNKVVLPNYSGRCSTELIPLLPKENCKREFLALLLRTKKVIHAAMENKTGSRMPRADMREVMKVEFKLPSLDEQERIIRKFIKFSKDYENLKDYEIKILEAISQLPSSILNEVFGQHKIPEEA